MPVCEQDFRNGVLQQTRVHFLGGRGIEAVVAIDPTQGNQVSLRWLLYDGHGNLVRTMAPDYTLSGFQWRGVWGEVQGLLGAGRGYCANLGHPEDETGLVYMRARYYEPATGRFISEDPARDGVNWYLYADGNPVGKVDGDGQRALDPIVQVAILGMLTGFFVTLGFYAGVDIGLQQKTLGIEKLRDAAIAGCFSSAMAWVALAFKQMYGTEGIAARIPLKVGYSEGFSAAGGLSFMAGYAMGITYVLYLRAGQALAEMFLIDYEAMCNP